MHNGRICSNEAREMGTPHNYWNALVEAAKATVEINSQPATLVFGLTKPIVYFKPLILGNRPKTHFSAYEGRTVSYGRNTLHVRSIRRQKRLQKTGGSTIPIL